MRAEHADVGCREVGPAEAHRRVRGFRVAKQDQRRLLRLEQPLVRRDRDRIGPLQPRQPSGVGRAEAKRPRPGGVDVDPSGRLSRVERVDRPRCRRAGGEHEAGPGRVRQVGRPYRAGAVGRRLDEIETEQVRRLPDREVRRRRGHHPPHALDLARRPECGQVGERRAGRHVAAVHAEVGGEPSDGQRLRRPRHGCCVGVQQVLVQGGVPQGRRPREARRRRVHVGERRRRPERCRAAENGGCQPRQRRPVAQPRLGQGVGQVEGARGPVPAQPRHRPVQECPVRGEGIVQHGIPSRSLRSSRRPNRETSSPERANCDKCKTVSLARGRHLPDHPRPALRGARTSANRERRAVARRIP